MKTTAARTRYLVLVSVLAVLTLLKFGGESDLDAATSGGREKASTNEPNQQIVATAFGALGGSNSGLHRHQDLWSEGGVNIFASPPPRGMKRSRRTQRVALDATSPTRVAKSRIRAPSRHAQGNRVRSAATDKLRKFVDYESEYISLPLAEVDEALIDLRKDAVSAIAAVRPPDFPYVLIGFYAEADETSTQVFISSGLHTEAVRIGDTIAGDWRLVTATPTEATFWYLPNKERVLVAYSSGPST